MVEQLYSRVKSFIVRRILGLADTPHSIALGAAIGVFVAWTPTIPFQMITTLVVCIILRANKLVGQPIVWITNPVTAVPIYWFNFIVGDWILPGDYSGSQFAILFNKALHAEVGLWEHAQLYWDVIYSFFYPLWIGSIIVGIILAVPTYLLFHRAVVLYREKHPLLKSV